MQILGSDTSRTLSGPFLSVSFGDGNWKDSQNCDFVILLLPFPLVTHRYSLGQESIDALHGNDEAVPGHRGQGHGLRPLDAVLASDTAAVLIVLTNDATISAESDWAEY